MADGLIVIAEYLGQEMYRDLKHRYRHIVFIDTQSPEIKEDVVYIEREEAAFQAVSPLTALGHKRIAFIGVALLGSSRKTVEGENRFEGYRRALLQAGLSLSSGWIKNACWSMDGGFTKMKELLQEEDLPTALFGASDLMSIGAMRTIQEEGLGIRKISPSSRMIIYVWPLTPTLS